MSGDRSSDRATLTDRSDLRQHGGLVEATELTGNGFKATILNRHDLRGRRCASGPALWHHETDS